MTSGKTIPSSSSQTCHRTQDIGRTSGKPLKGPTDKQIEVRLSDGRRRITPLFIPPIDGITSDSQTFSSSSGGKTSISIERREESNSSVDSRTDRQQTQDLTLRHTISTHSSNFLLPALEMDRLTTTELFLKYDKRDVNRKISLQIENSINSSDLSSLRLIENGSEVWRVLISAQINGIAANEYLIGCSSDDNSLHVFNTSNGRPLCTPIVLNTAIARLTCHSFKIMIITIEANLWLWDFAQHKVIIKGESLDPLLTGTDVSIISTGLTERGYPLIYLSNGKSYVFDEGFGTWTLISNSNDILIHSFDPNSDPLSSIQSQTEANKWLNTFGTDLQQWAVLSYIDQQLSASLVKGSTTEYHFWFMALAQHLTNESMETRIREMCQYLIGPVFKSSKSDSQIIGNDRHLMLREVLSIIATNLRFQRIYIEFKEQLDLLSTSQ